MDAREYLQEIFNSGDDTERKQFGGNGMKKYLWSIHWKGSFSSSFTSKIVTDEKDVVKAIEVLKQIEQDPKIDINRIEFICEVYA